MNKKSLKSILLTTTLTVGLSFLATTNAQAAEYTAVSGDSLYKISRAYNTSVANLMVANNFTNYNINVGQVIHIPDVKHTVVKGDTLYKISQKYNISLTKLRQANNVYTDYIYVGQVLDIPLPPATTEKVKEEEIEVVSNVVEANDVEVNDVEVNEATSVIPYTNEELDLLARLIRSEAEGQPYEAMVAVGSVVVNRVQCGLFAPTISSVINQKIGEHYQFTPVQNGWINRPATEESIRAAKDALSGVDTTNGAIWYYDDSTTNQWILSKPVSVQYGNMIFAYK